MKNITINDNVKQDLIKQFTEYINNTKFNTDKLYFNADISQDLQDIEKPTVYISALAYLKMLMYVQDTDTEIAWHGTVTRNVEQNYYHITDVFLYPQIIRATTVDTEQEKYNKWIEEIEDDETVNTMRFQGHSHVNMTPSPSGTDTNMYKDFLQMLPKNDYYIFMIMNKQRNYNIFIYDLAKNLIYETADIDVRIIGGKSYDLLKSIKDEKELYCEKPTYITLPQNTYNQACNRRTHREWWEDEEYKYDLDKDTPPSCRRNEDVNDMIDDIAKKYKNSQFRKGKK